MKKPKKNKTNNIVRLDFDADFYVDRAIRAVNRCQYDKALKYFGIAIEKDPNNSYNYLNLAGLLAELGRFEESNEILEILLYDIAPKLYSCQYYLANNLISIGEFELAGEYLMKYIQNEPDGEYIGEAEELLQVITSELGSPKGRGDFLLKQEEARFLFEMGDLQRAEKILEETAATQMDDPSCREPHLVYTREDPVLDCILQQMSGYSKGQRRDAQNLWTYFVANEYRDLIIRKVEAWAAAIEYMICADYRMPISRKDMASKYSVSISSVNRNVNRLIDFREKHDEPF